MQGLARRAGWVSLYAAAPLGALLLVGCAAHRIVPLNPPVRAEVPSELSTVDVVLHDFSVSTSPRTRASPAKDTGSARARRVGELRRQFLSYMHSRAGFANVVDPTATRQPNPDALRLDVRVDANVQTSRTWALDFLALVTLGLWPVEPQWGRGDVSVTASLHDVRGREVWHTALHEETPYTLIFFAFYRTHAIEEALRKSYERAFARCADALAASHDTLVAKLRSQRTLGSTAPSPRADTPLP